MLLNDLSEKKAKLEKFKTFNRDIDSHSDLVKKLNEKLQEDASLKSKEIDDTLKRYDDIRKTVNEMIAVSNIFNLPIHVFNGVYFIASYNYVYRGSNVYTNIYLCLKLHRNLKTT